MTNDESTNVTQMAFFDVAVIGGGASGTLFVSELLRRDSGWSVLWLTGDNSVGDAYSTNTDVHLLNVPAARMSAFSDKPDHFVDWLTRNATDREFEPTNFVPRRFYGSYLKELRGAAKSNANVRYLAQQVEQVEYATTPSGSGWRLRVRNGETYDVSRIVIAVGLPSERKSDRNVGGVMHNPWKWFHQSSEGVGIPADDEEIFILGSGLTAMDVVVGLRDLGYSGFIRVTSRSGRWSEPHAHAPPLTQEELAAALADLRAMPTARSYLRTVRHLAVKLPWRSVVDALRPQTQELWSALPPEERSRFLRHVFAVWNRHRHRAPTETAQRVADDSRVVIEKGQSCSNAGKGSFVFDCRGFALTAKRKWTPFLSALIGQGILAPSSLGIGLVSQQPNSVALLGALRFGEEFECTAVPEIRTQALAIIDAWTAGQGIEPTLVPGERPPHISGISKRTE